MSYEGRLELTWTNKTLRLLAHEDGRYEWVSPADYRVAEVRLLDDVAIDAETRTERWRLPTGLAVRTQPAVVGETVYVVDETGLVHAVDTGAGEELWNVQAGSADPQALVVIGGVLFVASAEGILNAMGTAPTAWIARQGGG